LTIAARPYRANGAPRWGAHRATSRSPRVTAGKRSAAGIRPVRHGAQVLPVPFELLGLPAARGHGHILP
jgi:hypothetical protein